MQFTKRDVNKQYRNNTQSASGGTSGGGGVNVTVSSSGIGVDADWVLRQIKQNKVYIITTGDAIGQTDSNVYSALRVDQEIQENNDRIKDELGQHFIRKDQDDSTNYALTVGGKLTGKEGVQFGETFVPGIAGGQGGRIDGQGNGELDSLIVRKFLEVPELRFNRVMVELGDKWNAPGAGIIEEVTIDDGGTTGTCKLKLEEGEYGAIAVGDICMGIFHSESTPSMNATADSDDGKGNFQFAGFYTCYFRITSVSNAEGKVNNQYFTYALRPTDGSGGSWNKAWHPSEAMHFVVYGSFTDTSRQTSVYTTRTYTRMLAHQNTWEFSAGNIGLQYGDMTNLSIFGIDMSGYSIYLNNVYFTGTIRQVDSHGHEIMTANDRGAYVAGETYAYYDRVSTSEGLWLCINENGTNTAPSADNSDWLLQVPAGESLQPYGHWSSNKTPYPANSVVSFADRVWVSNKETSEPPYPAYLLSDGSYAILSDNGYALAGETESDDWDLLIDISGITSGEDGEGLEVQYSADKTNWHTTPLETDLYFRQRVGSSGAWSPAYLMVGEAGQDGDYKDFEFAVNQSTTTAPTSGWQDAPPTVPNGYYLWMRVRWVYGDGRQPSAWAVTRIKGDKGDKGDSNVLVDFTNEIIQVACDSAYKAAGAQTKATGVNMYYGTNSCAISEITVSGTHSEWASVNSRTATITLTIPDQAIVSEITYDVAVTGTYGGQTYTRTVKLVLHGVRGGADGSPAVLYELEPSVDTIAKYKDDTLSVANISCTRIKYVGDQRSVTTDGGLRYRIDDTGDEVSISNGQNIPTSRINKSITFYLYINDTLVDKERIPLITDGKDGAGFALAGAWSSEHGTYSKMSVVTMGGASFVAKVDTTNPPLWCYKLSDGSYAKTSDGGYLLTGEENTAEYDMLVQAPSAPLDSISDEFIFKNSTTKPARPTSQNTDDYVPAGWTDDPVGVSITFPTEYVCKRTRKNGVWGEYSDPAVFAQFGKDGAFKSRVFVRTNTKPATPTGGTYDNPIPNGWSDGIPAGTAVLWSSVCTFKADGTSSGWSEPSPETDTDTLDIEFSPSTTKPSAPSGSTPYADHESEGWYDPNSPNFGGKDYIWRAERKVSNGVYDGAWTITRIKGEKGDKGEGYNHRGDWVSGMTLAKNDVVNMGGGTYVARHDNVTAAPLSSYLLSNGDRILLSDGGYALNGQLNLTDYWVMVARPEDGKDGKDFEFIFKLTETEDTRPSKPTSQNTDDYVPSGWTDDATGISLAYRAEWFCMRKKENGVWGEYSDPVLWSRYAEDGEAAVFADLDNEMDAVTVDEKGVTTSPWAFFTNVSLLAGAQGMAMSAITFEAPTGVTGTADVSTGACTIAIASGTTIGDKAAVKINISGTIGDKTITRTLTFTIKGVVGGVVYRLVPMYNAISKSASGSIIPSASFPVRIQKIVNGVVSNAGNNEAVIYYSINGAGYNACQNFSTPWWQIPISNTVSMLGIQARLIGTTTVIDEETIHTVDDGATGKGVDNVLRYFRLSNSDTSLTGSGTGYSWSTTKPTRVVGTYIWACDVTKYTDGTYIYTNDSTYNTLTKWCNQYCFCLTGAAGDEGDRGPFIYQSKWDEDSNTTYYHNGKGDTDTYVNCVYYNGLWYICKLSHTHANDKLPTNTNYWTEMANMKYVASEVILAQKGSIDLFQSMSIKVVENNITKMKMDIGGLEQYIYGPNNEMVNFMRFGNGVIGYYDSDGNAIWEIQSDGKTKFFSRTASNKYSKLSLYQMASSINTMQKACIWVEGQGDTNIQATHTYYELTEKADTVTGYNIGYTGYGSAPTAGESPAGLTQIADGYYCDSGIPAQSIVTVDESPRYYRMIYHYKDGYCDAKRKYEWQ